VTGLRGPGSRDTFGRYRGLLRPSETSASRDVSGCLGHTRQGDHDPLLQAAGGQQPVGAVEDCPQHDDPVAGLRGQPNRRRQLGEPGVGVAEVDEGAAQGGTG